MGRPIVYGNSTFCSATQLFVNHLLLIHHNKIPMTSLHGWYLILSAVKVTLWLLLPACVSCDDIQASRRKQLFHKSSRVAYLLWPGNSEVFEKYEYSLFFSRMLIQIKRPCTESSLGSLCDYCILKGNRDRPEESVNAAGKQKNDKQGWALCQLPWSVCG